ncbi:MULTISPECIES: NlpC/P60 family protein [unclassified Arthrobacter]|uniref:NlpC/P60 family protein n=1 Tax=unclassified Arthrobacter TaxID=235627 RepID=UPI001E44A47F|nr:MULTISPECIES: NlpC/P60 family protein [unclassified Arthrobacter]MCC9145845.1 C40 family peptidase [Arthrobacter sp. zg-Y919]MDK1277074.1 NlpC/P60 family protein [Arthrobacter sp. zg.Y919]WIB03599.1 NlpC/P60 family protein [Arthrobacter sp. zg-Y919]
MTTTVERARHRAPVERTTTLNALAGAVSSNAGTVGRQAAVIAAASGLVLTTGVAANASGADVVRDVQTSTLDLSAAKTLQVPADVAISFERDGINGVIVAPEPAAAVEAAVALEAPAAVATGQQQVRGNAAVAGNSTSLTTASARPVQAATGVASTIASAAYAQLGVGQDCTRLVTNALAAAGINHHGYPASYLSLGRTVSAAEAMPGDLIYYVNGGMGLAHIAVYVGGGQAVHGGFNGGSTVVAPAELGSGGVYIRVGG